MTHAASWSAWFLLAAVLAAQSGGDSKTLPERQLNAQFETEATGPAGAVNSLAQYCSAVMGTQPSPIPAGGTGRLRVVLALRHQAVLVPGSFLQLRYAAGQSGLALGQHVLEPPRPGRLAKAWVGKPVYEDTLQIDIPVAVDAGLPAGTVPVAMTIAADVYSGDTGAGICRAQMPIHTVVAVGPAPAALRAGDGDRPRTAAAEAAAPGPAAAPEVAPAAAEGQIGQPAPDRPEPGRTAVGLEPPAAAGDDDWWLFAAGALLLVGLAVLLLARHRGG